MRLLEAMGYQLSAIERTYRYLDDLRAGRSTGLPASLEALLAGAGPAAPLPGQVEAFSAELGRTVERLSRSLLGMVLADRPGGGVPGEEEAPGGDPPPRSFAFAQDDGGGRSRSRGGDAEAKVMERVEAPPPPPAAVLLARLEGLPFARQRALVADDPAYDSRRSVSCSVRRSRRCGRRCAKIR